MDLVEEIALGYGIANIEPKLSPSTTIGQKNDITIKENELNIMKNRYEQRVVNSYLKGRISDLEKVLSSTSWRQAVYRTCLLYTSQSPRD